MLLFLTSVDVLITWYCIDQALLVLHGHGGGSMVLFASEVSLAGIHHVRLSLSLMPTYDSIRS